MHFELVEFQFQIFDRSGRASLAQSKSAIYAE